MSASRVAAGGSCKMRGFSVMQSELQNHARKRRFFIRRAHGSVLENWPQLLEAAIVNYDPIPSALNF